MKIKVKHTVIYTAEEDSANWDQPCETPEDLLKQLKRYIEDDLGYVLDSNSPDSITSEIVP